MSCKALGEKTLITKGTLTGVLDRMEARGWLISRKADCDDARRSHVALTPARGRCYSRVFRPICNTCSGPLADWMTVN